ncbi:MAG: hypothetical protein AAF518_19390 [Spirochaetota bacterium]
MGLLLCICLAFASVFTWITVRAYRRDLFILRQTIFIYRQEKPKMFWTVLSIYGFCAGFLWGMTGLLAYAWFGS